MKDVRFYLEHATPRDKRKGIHSGNVAAILYNSWYIHAGVEYFKVYDSIAALMDTPNSPVCSTNVHDQWLRENCKRISEAKAREIHPELFKYLDQTN